MACRFPGQGWSFFLPAFPQMPGGPQTREAQSPEHRSCTQAVPTGFESAASARSGSSRRASPTGGRGPCTCRRGARLSLVCALLSALGAGPSARAAVALPFHDAFAYAEGRLNDVGSPNWAAGSTGWELAVSNSAALAAPEGFMPATGRGVRRAPSGTARRSVLEFMSVPAQDGREVFVSLLIQVASPPPATQLIAFLDNNSSSQSAPQAGLFLTPDGRLGVGKKTSQPGFVAEPTLGTAVHLVVMRYRFQPGNDRVDLWVDPDASTYESLEAPPSLGFVLGGTDPAFLQYFQIYCSPQAGGVQYLDELRIGRSWAEVVPSGAPPAPGRVAFVSQPADGYTNQPLPAVVLQVQSLAGTPVHVEGVPITLFLVPDTVPWTGTATRLTDATGRAVFDDLQVLAPATNLQLRAIAGPPGESWLEALSRPFAVHLPPLFEEWSFTSIWLDADSVRLSGGGPEPGQFVQLLASTEPAAASSWLLVDYGNLGPEGSIQFRAPRSPALPRAFYRLRSGDTGTKLEPPAIGVAPAPLTVTPGFPAEFRTIGIGPQLHYLWLSNGVPMWDQTGAVFHIPEAQPVHEADYQVIVANVVNSVTSAPVRLRVANLPPTILIQPNDQEVVTGDTAVFSVGADGTVPLRYQWFHQGMPLPGATAEVLVLHNVGVTDEGAYQVLVSNAWGMAWSQTATLSVSEVPTAPPVTNLMGFAMGVTGGAGGSITNVSTYAQLRGACRLPGPWIIRVQGPIVVTDDYCYITQPNKTIVGVGTDAAIYGGGLRVAATNIIIANLFFSATNHSNADGVTIDTSSHGTGKHVWVDHCTFFDCRDGSLDITKGADFVTVSWCKFFYSPIPRGTVNHEFVNLIASSDSDRGDYHVTFHHNWYGPYCRERMPSVRFGRVHVFNNYYDCFDNNYCIRTRIDAEVLVENNYFLGVQNPWERYVTSGNPGRLKARGNITRDCTWRVWTRGVELIDGNDELTDPALTTELYPYTLTPTEHVPYYVQTYAGAGKYPYVQP